MRIDLLHGGKRPFPLSINLEWPVVWLHHRITVSPSVNRRYTIQVGLPHG